MNEEIIQIAKRLAGLREVMELTREEMAAAGGVSLEEYKKIEVGQVDISVCFLQGIARTYKIPLDTLMFGEEPRMSSYFLTRCGKGISIERQKAYKYQSLASGFKNRTMDPFIVTVEPTEEDAPISLNTHEGQEFNSVISGRLQLMINGKVVELSPGDSIYFDASLPHGMKALDGKKVQFFAMIS
ncbi:MAG: cupin domain-containing protein [Bacteroidaceae bacterium]|nr:cupin domain-containing protein [Bacteroidaceae bacterium]